MKTTWTVMILIAALGLPGCGSQPTFEPAPPLTIAEWKSLPVAIKYEPETFERLKEGEPKLTTAEGWESFRKSVVVPFRLKDLPGGAKKT